MAWGPCPPYSTHQGGDTVEAVSITLNYESAATAVKMVMTIITDLNLLQRNRKVSASVADLTGHPTSTKLLFQEFALIRAPTC